VRWPVIFLLAASLFLAAPGTWAQTVSRKFEGFLFESAKQLQDFSDQQGWRSSLIGESPCFGGVSIEAHVTLTLTF
jgi:hypothetical protein